jgi:hypothetical protein
MTCNHGSGNNESERRKETLNDQDRNRVDFLKVGILLDWPSLLTFDKVFVNLIKLGDNDELLKEGNRKTKDDTDSPYDDGFNDDLTVVKLIYGKRDRCRRSESLSTPHGRRMRLHVLTINDADVSIEGNHSNRRG